MRSIVIGALVAAGLSLVTTVPAISAPANVAAVGQAAAEMGSVTQARCWCTWRGWRGYCRRWRCWGWRLRRQGAERGCGAHQRSHQSTTRRANGARRVFVRADEIGVFRAQRACGAAKLIGGRATLN